MEDPTHKETAEELKGHWKTLLRERIDDKVRAERIFERHIIADVGGIILPICMLLDGESSYNGDYQPKPAYTDQTDNGTI